MLPFCFKRRSKTHCRSLYSDYTLPVRAQKTTILTCIDIIWTLCLAYS